MKKRIFIALLILIAGFSVYLYAPFALPGPYHGSSTTIGEIKVPSGYTRIDGMDPQYSEYLRSIPLKENGTPVMKYTGDKASKGTQGRSYAVLDIPILSNAEQCADACMHLRAIILPDFNTGA